MNICSFLSLGVAAVLVACICLHGGARGEPTSFGENWRFEHLEVVPMGDSGGLHVTGGFLGVPWTDYQMRSSVDGEDWQPVALAAEGAPGHYRFHDLSDGGKRLYRAEFEMPGAMRVFDAYYHAGIGQIWTENIGYGLAWMLEFLMSVEDLVLDLEAELEQGGDAVSSEVNVGDLQDGNFLVSWAGDEQVVNGGQVEAAVQGYEVAREETASYLGEIEEGLGSLESLLTFGRETAALVAMEGVSSACRVKVIQENLTLPVGAEYACYETALAWFDLEALALEKKALERKKAALEKRMQKLRDEAARKRRLADMPIQVFGINGTWYVRWGNIEHSYSSESEARGLGVDTINTIINARRKEAAELERQADALSADLVEICSELESACELLAVLDPEYEQSLEHCEEPVDDPEDEEDPRAHFGSGVDFDPKYLDDMWEEMFREWQKRKDRLRTQLERMGASQETIDKAMARMDQEPILRRKWMAVFCDEPIKLKLQNVNQFTDFEFDVENATWEVEYMDIANFKRVRVVVGKGGELCIPTEEVKRIFEETKRLQFGRGNVMLVNIEVSFDKVFADGSREPCFELQQINVWEWTREKYDQVVGGLPPKSGGE